MTGISSVSPVLAGRYRLVERIGAGAMAEVFSAEDVVLGRRVAVKMLHPGIDAGSARERLRSEVRLLAQLSHRGLVAVYDAGEQDGRGFLVMQLIPGGTLADRFASGPLPREEVRRGGLRLADVLGYLHARGLVHRDLKPSNVLVQDDGQLLLTDFGIARMLDAAHLTATGTTVGTATYMAPEQVEGRPAGPPVDVYALGLMLIQGLTGEPVYQGSNALEVAAARLTRPPEVPVSSAGPLADLLQAMTSNDPADRPSAAEVADRLRRGESSAQRPAGVHEDGGDATAVLPTLSGATFAVSSSVERFAHRARDARHRVAQSETRRHAAASAGVAGLRAKELWRRRTVQLFGLRADLVVAVSLAVLALFALVVVAGISADGPVGTNQGTPSPPAGAERLPSDLERLEKAVAPR